jgi:rfaE bifunctional protein nucleotidyltransferase chain/domain
MKPLQILESKIRTRSQASILVQEWKNEGQKVVFSNGCFDILHLGHVEYLAKAAALGSKLILGINTDASVSRLKGPSRPINPEMARAKLLAALSFVDAVVLFDEETPLDLITSLVPNVLVKGNDYAAKDIVGYDVVTKNGGTVETIELTQGFSTTATIAKMQNNG